MKIVVNIANFSNQSKQQSDVLSQILKFATHCTQHQWWMVDYEAPVGPVNQVSHIQWVQLTLPANHRIGWQYWLNYKLIRFAKKHHADCILHSDGLFSNRGAIHQYAISYHPLFVGTETGFAARFCKLYSKQGKQPIPTSLKSIAVQGESGRKQFALQYSHIPIESFLSNNPSNYQKMLMAEKQQMKDQFTKGYEYFVYAGTISENSNLISLLKAFTQFKKWQQSNMQLVLISNEQPADPRFLETLALYKHKNEVVIVSNATELERTQLLQAAYMAIFPMDYCIDFSSFFISIEAGVPLIVRQNADILEWVGEAGARLIEPNPESIAAAMIELYKDENKYHQLADHAKMSLQQAQTPTLESILAKWFSVEITA